MVAPVDMIREILVNHTKNPVSHWPTGRRRCAALSFYRQGELIPRGSAWYKKTEITFSDLMALMRRKTWGDKYFNSEIPPEQKVFSQDDLQVLIYQLIKVA